MRVTVTGASGLVGSALLASMLARDFEVTVLSRDPRRAVAGVDAFAWQPGHEPAPVEALSGRDAIVNLAGESIAQRWTEATKRKIHDSRAVGTRHLVQGLRTLAEDRAEALPPVLVSASAVGYYGPHGDEPLDEEAPAGMDFLAQTCQAWEAQAQAATSLGIRVVQIRIGVVLARAGGALAQMLPPFRIGIGGPVAGGRQFVSWIHLDDLVGLINVAIEDQDWSGPVNATAPEPVTNRDLAHALGRALRRPAVVPVPGFALRLLYGEMSQLLTTGARVLPAKALVLGHRFGHPQLDGALQSALSAEPRP
jgi:uncharacterized protein